MTIESLLVHVEAGDQSRGSMIAALDLAKTLKASVTGIYPIAGLEALAIAYGGRSQAYQKAVETARVAESEQRVWLEKEAGARGVTAGWLSGEGDAAAVTTMASRYFDLTVAARNAPTESTGWNVVEEVLMSGGRPCLILPPGYGGTIGKRVLLGWNASRESSRALAAALPILKRAERVSVIIGPPRDRFSAVRTTPDLSITRSLERHGIKSEAMSLDLEDASAGQALLAEAARQSADLLVMGAYGKSWTREWVFGGTTRHVLNAAAMPILMSC